DFGFVERSKAGAREAKEPRDFARGENVRHRDAAGSLFLRLARRIDAPPIGAERHVNNLGAAALLFAATRGPTTLGCGIDEVFHRSYPTMKGAFLTTSTSVVRRGRFQK